MASAGAVRAGGAFVEIFAKDGQFQQAMARVQGKMKAIGQSMQRFGTMFSLAGTAIGVPMVLAARQAAGFEDAILGMKAAAGLADKDVARLRDEALRLSKAMGIDPAKIANAFLELTKAGMDVEDVLAGAGKSAVEFARVSGVEMQRAAEFMKVSMNVFGISAKDAVDTLSAAADASETSIAQMVESFSQVGSAGKTFDQTLFGVSQAMAGLARYGIMGEEAGTAIKTMLTKLVSPTNEAHAALATLGLTVRDFRDEAGKLLPIAQIAGVFSRALKKMGGNAEEVMMAQAALVDVFEQRGIKVIGAFADLGEKGFENIAKAMEGNLPVAVKFQIMMSGITGGFEKLSAATQRMSIAFTQALGPAIGQVVDKLVYVMDAIGALMVKFPGATKAVAGLALGLFGLGTALIVAGIGFKVIAVALGAIFSPIGLVLVAVGLLVAAAYKLSPAFQSAVADVNAALAKLDFANAMDQINLTIAVGLVRFVQFFDVAFNRVKDLATGMVSYVQDQVNTAANALNKMMGRDPNEFQVKGAQRREQDAIERSKRTDALNKQYEDTIGELRKDLDRARKKGREPAPQKDPGGANNAKRDPFRDPLGGPMPLQGKNEITSAGTFASSILGQLGIGPKIDIRERAAKAQEDAAKAQNDAAVQMKDLNGNMARFIDVMKQRVGDRKPTGKTIDMTKGDVNDVPKPVERPGELPWWADQKTFEKLNGGPAKPDMTLEQGMDELKRFNRAKMGSAAGSQGAPLPTDGAALKPSFWEDALGPVQRISDAIKAIRDQAGPMMKAADVSPPKVDRTDKDMVSLEEKTAAATQKAADLLAKIYDQARRGGIAFA